LGPPRARGVRSFRGGGGGGGRCLLLLLLLDVLGGVGALLEEGLDGVLPGEDLVDDEVEGDREEERKGEEAPVEVVPVVKLTNYSV